MKLYSWNVNGIRAIQKKGFVDWIASEQPDILCIQETKANVDQLDDALVQIDGYASYWSSHETKKGYSGVALYTRLRPKAVHYGVGEARYDCEGRIIVAEYDDFVLLNVYFPNGGTGEERLRYKLDFYDAMLCYCNARREAGDELIVCGDFNTAHNEIDIKNPKENENVSGFMRVERDWLDKLFASGYMDTYRALYPERVQYSWWSYRQRARLRNVGWRLDYFVVTEALMPRVVDAAILDAVTGSDHCPVLLEV